MYKFEQLGVKLSGAWLTKDDSKHKVMAFTTDCFIVLYKGLYLLKKYQMYNEKYVRHGYKYLFESFVFLNTSSVYKYI